MSDTIPHLNELLAMLQSACLGLYCSVHVLTYRVLCMRSLYQMVPQYQPVQALEMITRWLADKPF